jgi:hypothetical protein
MKMQLTQNNFSIAKNPQAYSAAQQRQGAIVDKSLENFVQKASTEQPELAKAFNEVLQAMRSVECAHKVDVEIREGVPIFKVWKADGEWMSSIPCPSGRNLLDTLQETLERLKSKARGYY